MLTSTGCSKHENEKYKAKLAEDVGVLYLGRNRICVYIKVYYMKITKMSDFPFFLVLRIILWPVTCYWCGSDFQSTVWKLFHLIPSCFSRQVKVKRQSYVMTSDNFHDWITATLKPKATLRAFSLSEVFRKPDPLWHWVWCLDVFLNWGYLLHLVGKIFFFAHKQSWHFVRKHQLNSWRYLFKFNCSAVHSCLDSDKSWFFLEDWDVVAHCFSALGVQV